MPWKKMGDVPPSIRRHKGMPLSLAQANHWARIFDRLKHVKDIKVPAAAAWSTWNKQYKISGNRWVKKKSAELSEQLSAGFTPPPSGDAPAEMKELLDEIYTECRIDWVEGHPEDKENADNKESCARIAWDAVKGAGWKKNKDGKWVKS